MTFSSAVRDAIVLATVLGASPSLSPSAAQEVSTDVGFVEAVSGRVVTMSHGRPVLVSVLGAINDQTRFDLLDNSELNLCHYSIGRFVAVKDLPESWFQKTGSQYKSAILSRFPSKPALSFRHPNFREAWWRVARPPISRASEVEGV
jgi:hypothetical protein